MTTVRLTVGQAIVRFLVAQRSERDGVEHRLIEGMFGIFGHGNVAGLGEALLEQELAAHTRCRTTRAATSRGWSTRRQGLRRQRNRLSTMGCLSSIGPGATNMVTGAARRPSTGCPCCSCRATSSRHASRTRCCSSSNIPWRTTSRSTTASRPGVARYFDRVWRPEQLPLGAARCDAGAHRPGRDRGAVSSRCPEDVQAEAHDWPEELFETRVWHVARPAPRGGRADSCGGGDPEFQAAADRRAAAARSTRRPRTRCAPLPTRREFP